MASRQEWKHLFPPAPQHGAKGSKGKKCLVRKSVTKNSNTSCGTPIHRISPLRPADDGPPVGMTVEGVEIRSAGDFDDSLAPVAEVPLVELNVGCDYVYAGLDV